MAEAGTGSTGSADTSTDESSTGGADTTSGTAAEESTSESTGPAPLPTCEREEGLLGGINSYDAAAVDGQPGKTEFLDFRTTCVPQAAEFSTNEDGLLITEITLDCESLVDGGKEPPEPIPLNLRIFGASVELGPEPVELSYYYEFPWDHASGNALSQRISLHRDEQLLFLSLFNYPTGLQEIGASAVTGDTLCLFFEECGRRQGIEATAFGGDTIVELTGAIVSLDVDGREFLASADGFDPDVCPDGTEPYDPTSSLRVVAIDAALFVDR